MKSNKKPPTPPKRLTIPEQILGDEEALKEWKRVAVLLDGKSDERDQSLLVDYCLTHSELLAIRKELDSQDRILMGPKGGAYMNPLLTVMMHRQGHLASLRRDLYFTPKSRIEKQNKATMSKAKGMRAELQTNDDDTD